MKKLLLVAAMVLGVAGMSQAQLSDNAAADLKLQIVNSMSVSVTNSVNFGSLLAPATGTHTVAPASGAKFTVSGTPGASFAITLPSGSIVLNNGTTDVTFTPNLVASSDGTTVGSSPASGDSFDLGTSGATSGFYYFLLGGDITLDGSETAGVYTGSYTLVATYN